MNWYLNPCRHLPPSRDEDWPLAIKRLASSLSVAIAVLYGAAPSGTTLAQANLAQSDGPSKQSIDISVAATPGNPLATCRLAGQVILWVSRPVAVLDDMQENIGIIEAGLAQFGPGSTLEGCAPDGVSLDLSDRFANFLVTDEGAANSLANGRRKGGVLASQLAAGFYQLAEQNGMPIPLVNGLKVDALGSVSYQFTVVLIRNAGSGSFDAYVGRETMRTKFCARLSDADRRLSRLSWSSAR